ncbi:acetolactate synthase III, large subunit [Candidatus Terasakiella magnetica]|uniref:Acetolactate synthase n=1 Tax=Candidatus Terasakiella magnetica TaxID=1867952 RepID=A0A1C3REI5_9PROT|nr:biosynthetic-type acetolactate synthase large subunit [Candidatus Terasakiella magnetica]SCA55648.1 acetolactate synthase III, large subunit [Candidatus Terasakiella magnetica]
MSTKEMTGSEIIIQALKDQGVDVMFGLPGGVLLPLYDALFKQNGLRHILVKHEQAAVHAAEGYARSTGKVGTVLVTSGPGATNTVTGLVDAMMDSVPLVCLTGQVPSSLIGNDAFQEADITGITRGITKHNYLVKDVNDLGRVLHEAYYVARSGRPGPVLVDVPKDVLLALGSYTAPAKNAQVEHKSYKPQIKGETAAIKEALELIKNAKKPLFYGGGGIVNSGDAACTLFSQLVKMTGIPCSLTLMGLGAFPGSDDQFLGMMGMHGTYEANMAMHDCDVMINIGARFDDRVTGALEGFAPHSKKIHVDIDPSSINKNVVVDVPIIGDVAHVLDELIKYWKADQAQIDAKALDSWWNEINEWRKVDSLKYTKSNKVIKPQYALERIRDLALETGKDTFYTTEVGQHQMWAAQHLSFEKPKRWMTSGGLGTMGYGFPSAMGVQTAHPDGLVVAIAGDGSFQMNLQEIATLMAYRLPVKCFILNNKFLGMVRQWQEMFHGERYSESVIDVQPDFVKLAEAYGALGLRAENPGDLDDVIKQAYASDLPTIVDIRTDAEENVFPMIPSGAAHNEIILGPEGTEASEDGGSVESGVLV